MTVIDSDWVLSAVLFGAMLWKNRWSDMAMGILWLVVAIQLDLLFPAVIGAYYLTKQ